MKAIAFANRLMRDLKPASLTELSADARLEIVDAINAAIQTLDSLAGSKSKITDISIPLEAPSSKTVTATNGSVDVAGADWTDDFLYRTVRVGGDTIDNQIVGPNTLLHPYSGTSGAVTAIAYCDAVALPEQYLELVGHPRFLDQDWPVYPADGYWFTTKNVCRPERYWVEENAANQAPPSPAVIRFGSLPDQAYRLTCRALLGPARVKFADLMAPAVNLPFRENQIEVYLLPVCRGLLTSSELWRDSETKAAAITAADAARQDFSLLTPTTMQTPTNRTRTTPGF